MDVVMLGTWPNSRRGRAEVLFQLGRSRTQLLLTSLHHVVMTGFMNWRIGKEPRKSALLHVEAFTHNDLSP